MILKTDAIVLKSFDFRETSRIATFFTKEFGKVSGILKGIRKDPRKFHSSLDRFSVNEIVYYQYRNSDLHLISQCDLREFFFPVRQDIQRATAASYVSELVNHMMPAEEKNEKVYQLMMDFLASLQSFEDIHQLVHMFQIKILLYSGFKPHLDACVKCKRTITQKARFSVNDGGMVCLDCPLNNTTVHFISPDTVLLILDIEKTQWPQCLQTRLTPRIKQELKYVLNNFLIFHLGKKLKSAKYL